MGENDKEKAEEKPGRWFVMRHLNPAFIEQMLQKDSSGLLRKDGEPLLPPYRFFIPFQNLPRVIAGSQAEGKASVGRKYNPLKDDESLRSDWRPFVFIQAPEKRVEDIVKSDWNSGSRTPMTFYLSADQSRVSISDDEMHCLIRTLQDRRLKFFLDQPLDDFSVGDRVVLQMVPWTGKVAEVKKITFKEDRVKLTVGLNIFGCLKSITFPDIAVNDVKFMDKERGRLLSGNPITNYEEEIIDLLSHRYCQRPSEEVAEQDEQRLMRLATYTNIYIEDPDEQARFTALKLICACLREDRGRRARYMKEVQEMLNPVLAPAAPADEASNEAPSATDLQLSTFIEAYLTMALFISTRNPRYRDAVKDYRHAHPDCPDILRRYHSIVKGLRPKKRGRRKKKDKIVRN